MNLKNTTLSSDPGATFLILLSVILFIAAIFHFFRIKKREGDEYHEPLAEASVGVSYFVFAAILLAASFDFTLERPFNRVGSSEIYTSHQAACGGILFCCDLETEGKEIRPIKDYNRAVAICRIEDETTGDMGTIGIAGASGGLVRTF